MAAEEGSTPSTRAFPFLVSNLEENREQQGSIRILDDTVTTGLASQPKPLAS